MDLRLVEIPFEPDIDALLARLGLNDNPDEAEDVLSLLDRCKSVAQPKAAYFAAAVDELDAETGKIVIGGVEFSSALLAKKLSGSTMVWPNIVTCGRELYDFSLSIPDPFDRYWCDEIMQQALTDVRSAMLRDLEAKFHPGKIAVMGPGSLVEWPLEQQVPLFRLLDEAAKFCGVELTPTLLMLPHKSVSGILFPNVDGWVSCSMCPRSGCPNRRADYSAEAVAALDA